MSLSAWLVALAALLFTAVAAWLVQALRENQRLRRRLQTSATQLQTLQASFSRFAPDDVVERLITGSGTVQGEKKVVAVLFADLVGFTALSQSVEPDVLVRILNGYFERMSKAITDHRGHVSTFIGDGILAYFGALAPNPWQANDAAHAALAMRAQLVEYNRELQAKQLPALEIGIGLHRGSGVAGLVGSRALMEFAFVGRTVNVAARVQDLTRQLDASIILTKALEQTLDPRFECHPLRPTAVKGVEEKLEIFALQGYTPGG